MAFRHSVRIFIVAAVVGAVSVLGIISIKPAAAKLTALSAASNTPIYTVMNTSETLPDGVWFRNSPHTADTNRVTGRGVYKNEQVQLECYAWGDAVGPYGNRLWYFVLNVTRPVNDGVTNQGYLNAHYINDGKAANQIDAGVPQCGSATTPTPGAKSVFYSPNNTPDAVPGLTVADLNIVYDEWAIGGCSPIEAANIPNGVSILAGWSIGRLGPIYFLDAAGQQVPQVHTIILFDPGNTANLTGSSCDTKVKPSINSLLANWLKSNGSNRLIVLTGKVSEDQQGGRATFAGLWKYYFAGIWHQPFASRAQVCDYHNLGHQQVLTKFAWMVQNPIHGCPAASGAPNPVAWNP